MITESSVIKLPQWELNMIHDHYMDYLENNPLPNSNSIPGYLTISVITYGSNI